MTKGADYKWNFPMSNFAQQNKVRVTKTGEMLAKMKIDNREAMSIKKRAQIEKLEAEEGKKNLSFAGSQLMGMNNSQVGGMGGGAGNQSQTMGGMNSNGSLNDSSYMPTMSRT
jgi:hypothetical protein